MGFDYNDHENTIESRMSGADEPHEVDGDVFRQFARNSDLQDDTNAKRDTDFVVADDPNDNDPSASQDIRYWQSLNHPHLYKGRIPIIRYYMDGTDPMQQDSVTTNGFYFGNELEARPVQNPDALIMKVDDQSQLKMSVKNAYYIEPIVSALRQLKRVSSEDEQKDEDLIEQMTKYNKGIYKEIQNIIARFNLSNSEERDMMGVLFNLNIDGGKYNDIIGTLADVYGGMNSPYDYSNEDLGQQMDEE